MIKSKVFPENPKSWFPVMVQYEDREKPCIVNCPFDLRDRVKFTVLQVRVKPKT
jgi:hypothetical protein